MRQLLLLLLFVLPFASFAQNTESEVLLEKLGYQKVDLQELSKKQLQQKPCSTCPFKAKTTPAKSTQFSINQEINTLQQQVPGLEQKIIALKKDAQADPSVLQKYQTALSNTQQRITLLTGELANFPKKSSTTK